MLNLMDQELARQRREEMLREAGMRRLAKAAGREGRSGPLAVVAWELQRYGGRLRKRLRGR